MPDIHQAVVIEASPEKVYDAITSQEGLSGWWTPETVAVPQVNSIARFGFGPDYFKEMRIVELKPFEKVKWVCITGADEWVGTNISFKLEGGDAASLMSSHPEVKGQLEQLQHSSEATLLVFHHDNWKDYTLMFAECSYTWGQFLRSLKLWCEEGKGRPWPEQHRGV